MATWNQQGSGSFLGGIGLNNTNAPRASDANATLAMIRENNDLQRSGANNFGLQVMQGLAGLNDMYQQSKAQEREKEFQSQWGQAYANGDRNAMRQLMAAYPEQAEKITSGMKGISDDTRESIGNIASGYRLAVASGKVEDFIRKNADEMHRLGIDPQYAYEQAQKDPNAAMGLADHIGMSALGMDKYYDVRDKMEGRVIERDRLTETVRSNKASEGLQARGQDISAATARRGQDISASTARRGQDMAMQRSAARGGDNETRSVQLSDGRTVQISGKLHGAGANAFYEGVDNSGNTVRVPANAIAAPASSSANATNYAMKKDMNSILDAKSDDLDFMTGFTGGAGDPALGADLRSRWNGGEQRQLFMAAQRIQGRMQNQGIAAARDMGASGINTVAEAKMYFQGMPQVDYSSPEAIKQSIREIQQYTDNYNSQYDVNVGSSPRTSTPSTQRNNAQQSGNYSSLWGD